MAPVVAACRGHSDQVEPLVCFTGQHDEMLRQVTDYFEIQADFELKTLVPGQSLAQLTARLLESLDDTIRRARPDWLVVQGDTTSVLAASIAAFYQQVPLVHVEAGLRTGRLTAPWPEEFNRRAASIATTLHCAPTSRAAANLRREGAPAERVRVTGNTVIDALHATLARERARAGYWKAKHAWLDGQPVVLATVHRRENHGAGLENVCTALAELARLHPQAQFVLPVHLNPHVQEVVRRRLEGIDNLRLLPPLAYPEFVWFMDRAKVIVSDSGGIQEEALSLARPVVALREDTERIEAVEAGGVICVGCGVQRIIQTVSRLVTDAEAYRAMQVHENPFGDGRAAERIVQWMLESKAVQPIAA
jgi:UDP-N-acetylglucosamine 2-epimerase (non-hydrolysing)